MSSMRIDEYRSSSSPPRNRTMQMYCVRFAARAEASVDLEGAVTRFHDMSHGPQRGHVHELHWCVAMPGLPDALVRTLTIGVPVLDGEDPLTMVTAAVTRLLRCIEETTDAHVLRDTLNFADRYDGSDQCTHVRVDDDDGHIEGLEQRMFVLDTMWSPERGNDSGDDDDDDPQHGNSQPVQQSSA